MIDTKRHWEDIFRTRTERDVSWFEESPAISLRLMEAAGLGPHTCVVDIGGGDSRLVDGLLARGLRCVAVLDVSSAALARAQARLGSRASTVTWIEKDVTSDWSLEPMDIWHDRAVFHFLTAAGDRARYRQHLRDTLKPAGTAIIATFALDGPETCSGLPVVRYSGDTLSQELGEDFARVETVLHAHRTPRGAVQSFQYSRFRRLGERT